MLKFFRRIRKKLIDGGNLKRYLIYAVGEILLVMIGILLALQVNNWNELRKDKFEEIQALKDLRAEFISAQEVFLLRINSKREYEEKWKSLLMKIMDKDMPQSEKAFSRGSSGARITDFSNSTLNALLSTGKIDKITNDSLKYLLLEWKDVFVDYHDKEVEHLEFTMNKLKEHERHLFPTYTRGPDEKLRFIQDFHSNEDIRQFQITAYADVYYQNLLIENYHYLTLLTEKGALVENILGQILRLIDEEIESRTK